MRHRWLLFRVWWWDTLYYLTTEVMEYIRPRAIRDNALLTDAEKAHSSARLGRGLKKAYLHCQLGMKRVGLGNATTDAEIAKTRAELRQGVW